MKEKLFDAEDARILVGLTALTELEEIVKSIKTYAKKGERTLFYSEGIRVSSQAVLELERRGFSVHTYTVNPYDYQDVSMIEW